MKVLPRAFYVRNTLIVAKELLGKHLVRHVKEGEMVGKIVEVEAYRGSDDPASHTYRKEAEKQTHVREGWHRLRLLHLRKTTTAST